MNDTLKRRVLAWLRVPPQPHPPAGDPAPLRVFHAGRNYFRLRIAGWAGTQFFALLGIVFWTAMLLEVEEVVSSRRSAPSSTPTISTPASLEKPTGQRFQETIQTIATKAEEASRNTRTGDFREGWAAYRAVLVEVGLLLPESAFPFIWALKILGVAIYLIQIPLTYAVRRLDFEMRWYMVTDRSLRLRHGVWNVTESTMSFANVQQVVVTQGPLQRLLGLANVEVQSAGGGSSNEAHKPGREDMHLGVFQSVTNASEIRELIVQRLRLYREAGLGDPDDAHPLAATDRTPSPASALTAAHELLAETRALRAHLGA